MNQPSKLTLAEARKQGKLDQFVDERENDPSGDMDAFDRTVGAMAGRSKRAPETSGKDDRDG